MADNITVRPANRSDIETVARLFDDYRQFYEQQPDLAGATAFIRRRLDSGDSHVLLALDERQAGLGFTQLYPVFSSVRMARVWILNDLFVSPEARGRGVATKLMSAAANLARQNDVASLQLETASDNSPARTLYEKLGWKRESGFDHYSLVL